MIEFLVTIVKSLSEKFLVEHVTVEKTRGEIVVGKRNDLITILKQKYAEKNAIWEEVNFFGVRYEHKQTEKDIFNDFVGVVTDKECYLFDATTKPGWTAVKNPKSSQGVKGAANLTLGYHRNIWMVDFHAKGRPSEHLALCQRGNKVKIWRDVDRTGVYNPKTSVEQEGWYGINLHRASLNDSINIGLWGAGCQVLPKAKEFNKLLNFALNSDKYKKNKKAKFSYLLFDKSEIRL